MSRQRFDQNDSCTTKQIHCLHWGYGFDLTHDWRREGKEKYETQSRRRQRWQRNQGDGRFSVSEQKKWPASGIASELTVKFEVIIRFRSQQIQPVQSILLGEQEAILRNGKKNEMGSSLELSKRSKLYARISDWHAWKSVSAEKCWDKVPRCRRAADWETWEDFTNDVNIEIILHIRIWWRPWHIFKAVSSPWFEGWKSFQQ